MARDVLVGLRTTFITPFDRTDIQSLITSMDDSIDQFQQTAKAITQFEVTPFEPEMREIADRIVDCAELTQRAVAMLSDVANNAGELNQICIHITRIEGDADDIHDRGIGRLYQEAKAGDPMNLSVRTKSTIIWKMLLISWRTSQTRFRALS
jgi:hypothetical protein